MRSSQAVRRRACVAVTMLALSASCTSRSQPPAQAGASPEQAARAEASASAADPAAGATAQPEFECRFTDGPITIDGKADEPAWARAQVIDQFRIPWAPPGPAREPRSPTRARLLWDDQHLYFFAEMPDRDLYADITEHQGELWYNDVFELFFKPAADKLAYYEFEVNAANATLELAIPARGAGGYPRFKKTTRVEMKTAVTLDGSLNRWQDRDQGWTVEGRFRWSDFAPTGGRPRSGDSWAFNLCRYDYSVDFESPELTCIAPLTRPDFHRYEEFVPLRFTSPDIPRRAQSARPTPAR